MFRNIGPGPVTIDSFSLDKAPQGVSVVGFSIFDLSDTGGLQLDYKDGGGISPDLTKIRNYTGQPIQVQPNQTSTRYAMVSVKVATNIAATLSGCRVNYTLGGQKYTQVLRCEFNLNKQS
jgi:hypothetical protein